MHRTSEPHVVVRPRVLYVGTPVLLLATENPDGSCNLAPASSYWALGQLICLGIEAGGQTLDNLLARPGFTVSFPSPHLWRAVERIADVTGRSPVPAAKADRYRHEPDKFALAGLTAQASDLVVPPRVAECDLQFEAEVRRATPGLGDYHLVEAEVLRVHARPTILTADGEHIDPAAWQPTIFNFRHYYALGEAHGRRP
jgi:flavin reductase (DIM6/NTAB) family NADH-FMN oxidoreductase RutF